LPRPRNKENASLPRRWRYVHSAYFYQVPPGQEEAWDGKRQFRLGSTLSEALKTFSERVGDRGETIRNCGQMLDWYAAHVVPEHKNPQVRAGKLEHIKLLRPVFGSMPVDPGKFKPSWVYGYVERRVHRKTGKKALTSALREIETLSHAFTRLVRRGDIDRHPFKDEVRLEGELALTPRTRYIEDWEIIEALSLVPRRKAGSVKMIQAYIRLKLLTGLARSDLLRLRQGDHLREDGIHVTRHKTAKSTGRSTIYSYDKVPERREAVKMAIAARPCLSPYLFCNRRGECYIDEDTLESHGFDSMWQRFMDRVMSETKVKARFTEHDIRAKAGSDAESLEKARALLQHADQSTTQRVYRRRPEVV
jgi:integrase